MLGLPKRQKPTHAPILPREIAFQHLAARFLGVFAAHRDGLVDRAVVNP